MKTSLILMAFSAAAFALMTPSTALSQSGLFSRTSNDKQAIQQNSRAKTINLASVRQKSTRTNPTIISNRKTRRPSVSVFNRTKPGSSDRRKKPESTSVIKKPALTIPLGPDLVVTKFKLKGAAIDQGSFWGYQVEVTITNKGSAVAPVCPFVVIVNKSKGPGVFSSGPGWDLAHDWTTGKSLAPSQSVKINTTVAIPETWGVSKGSLQVCVNATQNSGQSGGAILPGGVNETNKQNNKSSKIGFTNPFQN